jgi:hypothetical protein
MGEARTLGVLLVVGSSRRRRRWGLLCSVGKGRGGKNPPGARGRGGREVKAAAAADDAETQRLLRRLSRACPAPRPHSDLLPPPARSVSVSVAPPRSSVVYGVRGAGVPELRRRRMRRGACARVRVRRASGPGIPAVGPVPAPEGMAGWGSPDVWLYGELSSSVFVGAVGWIGNGWMTRARRGIHGKNLRICLDCLPHWKYTGLLREGKL